MNILVTGCAGFIGFHLTIELLNKKKHKVIGIDNLNNYYDVKLKKDRLKILKKYQQFTFKKLDLKDKDKLLKLCKYYKIKYIINLAAQAGVRHSIGNPKVYFNSNILGFYNILEICREIKVSHLIFASTSSVYGNNNKFPLKENMSTDKPLSFYAASKKTNEVMAYSFSNIYGIPITGLRFFTVFGPFGRPDMSLFLFVKAIINKNKIKLFNNGNHIRDFTYVDKVVSAILQLIPKSPKKNIPYEIYNISSGKPIHLKSFLKIIIKNLGLPINISNQKLQKGDVVKTHGDINKLKKVIKINLSDNIDEYVNKFIKWYKKYYKI